MDVVEGRLRCNHEQAIVLASYSLQASVATNTIKIYINAKKLILFYPTDETRVNFLVSFHFKAKPNVQAALLSQ